MKAFCDRLDLTGTGVEGVETHRRGVRRRCRGARAHLRVDHPDSDHMHVVTVDVGAEEPVQIVCGAPNIAAGHQGARGHRRRGAARRLQDQEVEAARRCKLRHVLLAARAGAWAATMTASGCFPTMRPIGQPIADYLELVRYGARPGDHAEPPRLPFHGGHGARGGSHVPAAAMTSPLAEMAGKLELYARKRLLVDSRR